MKGTAALDNSNQHVHPKAPKELLVEDVNLSDLVMIESNYHMALKESSTMKQQMQRMAQRLQACERQNKVLKANISSLYKTAKAEIDRKGGQISELRRELDDLILRRNRSASAHGASISRSRSTDSTKTTSELFRSVGSNILINEYKY